MVDPTKDGTDEASIKPVSSLRSLFENKSGNSSVLTTPSTLFPSKPLAIPGHAQDEAQKSTRASLDITRISSPSSSSGTGFVQQGLGLAGPPVPRPRQHSSRALQRPVSTTSLCAPCSPPLVIVDPPTSSPKGPRPASVQPCLQTAIAKPLKNLSITLQSSRMAPVPPKRVQPPTMASSPRLSVAEGENDDMDLQHALKSIDDGQTEDRTRCLPPPVNRADKPKIPTKPALVAGKVSLGPLVPAADKRISPFSTPPSSDDSIGPEFDKLDRHRVSRIELRGTMERQAAPESAFHSLHETQHPSDQVVPQKLQGPDARRLGFTQDTISHKFVAEDPPGLPPRRVQGQRSSLQELNGPNGKQANSTTPFALKSAPRNSTTRLQRTLTSPPDFLPPPKRASTLESSNKAHAEISRPPRAADHDKEGTSHPVIDLPERQESETANHALPASEYPEAANSNRRHPYLKGSIREIDTTYDTRLIVTCGQYVCTTGHLTRIWKSTTGELVLSLGPGEKEIRVTALAFKPGVNAREEGFRLWLGTNCGDIQEIDIATHSIVYTKSGAHDRREIVKVHRHQSSMWTLDDGGKLCVWLGDETGLPSLQRSPVSHRVPKGHTFSIIVQDTLWMATGKDIRIFRPNANESAAFSITQDPLTQPSAGTVSSGAVISGQLDRVYFGHADGKVTMYSTTDFTCLGVINVSVYKISSLAGAGFHLWAGYNTGLLCVYDTRTRPWTTRKDWLAHGGPILSILVDRSSLWKDGVLRVTSLGADNAVRFWDGTLEDDWLENDMQDRDIEYCSFREITALVVTWNAGASTPAHFRYEENEPHFFQDVLQAGEPPDLLVFGFQELVDLEDKKLTAKTLFKANRKKGPSEQEHMSRQYRAWRDYLVRSVEDSMPSNEPYHLLHTASMVGLFSCVFIKASQRHQIRNINAAEIKRGMGGLHGNKGALLLRFILDDSSLCLVNCHLAAGQTQTVHRNNDLTAILESMALPPIPTSTYSEILVGGGDGSMILDNEICILNGDLNYRIDTMGRDTVVKAVNSNNLSRLLERDQLLVSRRRNPGFRIRAFKEFPIAFAPTYKYDVGSDRYDTSEKRRAPAWCDRILYRGAGKIKQLNYRRHEIRVSDHRPVSGLFKMRIKTISVEKRADAWRESGIRFAKAKEKLAKEAKVEYLRDVLGVPPAEAMRLV
ncbi:MAG: hypothetical protein ASARMPRED_006621 [Alectoria sarmentosa]|nr:MAG: hypothetical protein ASARMPRED_006621 [Alectoria sarmentosa]